jgi:membrane-associated protease RseP (regulator of RpoE activity)
MSDATSFINDDDSLGRVPSPSVRTWAKHIFFFLLTLFTATIAGVLQPFGIIPIFPNDDLQTWGEIFNFLLSLPLRYLQLIYDTISLLLTNAEYLGYGLKFSLSLLFILTAHEFGHYIACRIYKVDATLPFFIPTPPLIGPAGTLGAFIQIRSPLPSRKAIFDIGVAGPIAGFVALIPIAMIGFMTMQYDTRPFPPNELGGIYFSDALFTKFLAYFFNHNLNLPIYANPFYFAAWVGLLVTALNLIPSGQLDGGHAVFAVFGKKIHGWTGKIAFAAMAIFSILGWYFYQSPSALLFTILLGIMMRVGHPEPLNDTPLDFKRKVIAFLTLVIFILCFTPFPIQIR